jgi:hypothetical protein
VLGLAAKGRNYLRKNRLFCPIPVTGSSDFLIIRFFGNMLTGLYLKGQEGCQACLLIVFWVGDSEIRCIPCMYSADEKNWHRRDDEKRITGNHDPFSFNEIR